MGRKFKHNKKHTYQFYTCLYGTRYHARYVKAYCEYHKCYLSADNITEKKCNIKECKNLKDININNQPK